jgi:hypothetical protein
VSQFLTAASVLQCPHGGVVTATTTNTATQAGGALIVRASDTFLIAGCVFTLPSGTPHPCTSVQWVTFSLTNQVQNDNPLTESSVGLCLAADQTPQGPVLVNYTQTVASGL